MYDLKEIMADIVKQEEIVKTDLSNVPPSAYSGRLGKVNRAKENLRSLKEEYRTIVRQRAIFILVNGSSKEKFVDLAEAEFGCFRFTDDDLINELVKDINPRLYTDVTSSTSLFHLVGNKLEELALELGVQSYPSLNFESKYKTKLMCKEDLNKIIKEALFDQVGAEFVGLFTTHKASNMAIKEKFDGKALPILIEVNGDTLELAKNLNSMFNNIFIVSCGKVKKEVSTQSIASISKIDKAQVEKTLVKIKENMV